MKRWSGGSSCLRALSHGLTLVLACTFATLAWADAPDSNRPRTLRVAMLNIDRVVFMNSAGEPDGFGVDVLQRALRGMNLRIEYVPCTREASEELLLSGRVDLVFPVTMTEARAQKFEFTNSILISTWGTVYTRAGDRVETLTELAGKRVAAIGGGLFAAEFEKLNKDFQLGASLELHPGYDEVFEALRTGQVDAALGPNTAQRTTLTGGALLPSPIVFAPAPGRFMAVKGKERNVLDAIDVWMTRERATPDSEYWQLQTRWLSDLKTEAWKKWVGWLAAVFAGLAILSLLFVIALRRQVALRTSELAQKNRSLRDEIARREKAQAQLREREQLVNGIFENLIFVAFLKEPMGRYLLVNKEFQRYVGRTEEEIIGKTDEELLDAEFAAYMRDADARAIREGRANLERQVMVGEEARVLLGVRFPVKDASGGVTSICGLSIDITEQKRAEEALRCSEHMLRDVINLVPHAIWAVDEAFRFVMVNEATAALLATPRDSMIGSSIDACVPEGAPLHWLKDRVAEFLGGVEWQRVEMQWTNAQGQERSFQTSSRRFRRPGSTQWAALVIMVDITDLCSAQDALAAQQRNLERLVEERTLALESAQEELLRRERLALIGQLTATVSHELRNPMATIRGSAYLINRRFGKTDATSEQVFERIFRNIDRCDRIIDELLDYARSRSLVREPWDLSQWLTLAFAEFEIPEGIQVDRALEPGLMVSIDPERMRRCVQNMVLNACQAMDHNEDRPRTLSLRCAADGENALMEISDTGEGMDEARLARIFEPLFSTKSYGIGLGLPLAKQVIELHGGTLNVCSEPGNGTSFVLRLPLLRDQGHSEAALR